MWWNDQVKSTVKKEAAWKEVLGDRDEDSKEICLEVYKEENRNVKGCMYQNKKEVHEQFGRNL